MTMTTREETIGQVLALLGATSDAEDQKWVRELTSKILDHGEHVRDMLATEQAVDARQTKLKGQELMQDRQQIYEKLESANMNERYQQLPHLHQLSKSIRQLNAQPAINLELESMMAAMEGNLLMLQELVGDGQELPWRLRFVTDVDPLSNQPITFGGDDTILTDSDGNLVWSDHCGTCRYELGHDDPRWRCMACAVDGVQCDQCHTVFSNVHSNCHPGCVHEQQHPVFARLDTRVKDSLSQTLLKIFQAWSIRPCFHAAGQADWLTYRQVLHRALQVSTFLLEDDATELLLCFPAGSMEYYFWDIGAALVGVPTIGLSTSPIPTEIPPTSHVACHPTVKTKLNIPTSCKLVALQDTEEYDPKHEVPIGVKDAPDDLYTTYFTSGSTGKPKPIYNTRKELLEDLIVLRGDPNPKCTLSFQPSCWASDRNLVYTTLFNGGRVGFSRLSPSLSEIVEDIAEVESTFLSVPPVLLQFIHSLNPPLGSRLSYVTTGGAPVGTKIMHAIAETYGVEVTESYGTTECGGIAVDGQILPDQRSKIRVRDPVTGEWLCSEVGLNNDDGEPRSSSIVGELWVGDHNTQDIVELVGSNIQVLGRSGSASSFKASNGKWCSLVDIEDEIMQSCFPELLFEAFVFEQSPGRLVFVARTDTAAVTDGARILAQVRKRSMLSPEMLPLSIVLTRDAFPKTVNLKIKRDVLANKFREEANHPDCLVHTDDEGAPRFSDAVQLASRVLGHSVDPKASFLENGGDSLTAVRWLHELKVNGVDISHENWRSIFSSPLEEYNTEKHLADGQTGGDCLTTAFEPPPIASSSAKHVLLTGATGFLGRHVLKELLSRDDSIVVVCLVRESSAAKIVQSSRIKVATNVPLNVEYKAVFHLAANVNHVLDYQSLKESNVDMTASLLRLRLAPMVYCSTSSTRQGTPPFPDGYTQTKWESEQMVQRSGGTCVWPPFLLWGSHRDWFTRLVQHCVKAGVFPVELGFLVAAPVEQTAKEFVSGVPCSALELDLGHFFSLLQREVHMKPVSLRGFVAGIRRDPTSTAFSIVPLLAESKRVGNPSVGHLKPFPLCETDVRNLLRVVL